MCVVLSVHMWAVGLVSVVVSVVDMAVVGLRVVRVGVIVGVIVCWSLVLLLLVW